MLSLAFILLAALLIFVLERPGQKESKVISALTYLILGVFPLEIAAYSLPLGIPAAAMLLIRKVDNRALKISAVLAGALAGWVYFTWLRPPGT